MVHSIYTMVDDGTISRFVALSPQVRASIVNIKENENVKLINGFWSQTNAQTRYGITFACGVGFGVLAMRVSARRALSRTKYLTVNDIPNAMFKQQGWIKGRVAKITDGDTFRVEHTPCRSFRSPNQADLKLSESTLQIRIAAVDTPETAKFGHSGQDGGNEATEYLRTLIAGQQLHIQLLSKDQYSRAVAMVPSIPYICLLSALHNLHTLDKYPQRCTGYYYPTYPGHAVIFFVPHAYHCHSAHRHQTPPSCTRKQLQWSIHTHCHTHCHVAMPRGPLSDSG